MHLPCSSPRCPGTPVIFGMWGSGRTTTKGSVPQVFPPQPETVGVCGSGECLNWEGMALLCSTNTQLSYLWYAMSKCCLTQQLCCLQGVQKRTASLIGAQAERSSTTKPGPCWGPHRVVCLSVLRMDSSAPFSPYPYYLYFWMYFFYSPNHSYTCFHSHCLCTFSHGFAVALGCSLPCTVTVICVFSFWQFPTSNYKAL